MSKRNLERKGGLKLDPDVRNWLKDAARNPAALTKKQRHDRARKKATYDLSPEVQRAVQEIAGEESTSASQVVEMLLWYGIHHYRACNPELRDAFRNGKRPAKTPKFDWNVEPPEAWKADTPDAVRTFKKYWGSGE